jgi:hypothetical protein
LAWLGLAWLGLAWLGLAWLGLAWLGLAWLGLAWLGLAWLRFAKPQCGLFPFGFVLPEPYPARACVSHTAPFSAAGMPWTPVTLALIIMNSWMARFCRDQARHS